jgi:hypothetical protein
MTKEDGLLDGCEDTCGFYQHRDWSRSAGIVNRETTFASAMSTPDRVQRDDQGRDRLL